MLGAIVICQDDPTRVEAVLNGLIAWAGVLGGMTAFGSGLAASAVAFSRSAARSDRADMINRGLGLGFVFGMPLGLIVFVMYGGGFIS